MNDRLEELQNSYDNYKRLKGEVPLAVSIVVMNTRNEIICVSRKDDHTDFGLVGGKVDPEDKDTLDASIRELFEETGLLYERDKFIKIYQGNHMDYWQVTYFVNVISDMDDSVFKHDEPHVVKWSNWQTVFDGSFGEYNRIIKDRIKKLINV